MPDGKKSMFASCLMPDHGYDLAFFCTDTPSTEIYTLSLHDALPILNHRRLVFENPGSALEKLPVLPAAGSTRSEEHTSELQSPMYLVCRLLLEKKKKPI